MCVSLTDTFSPYCLIFLTIADNQQSVVLVDVLLIILSPRLSLLITRLLHRYQTGFPFPRFCCSVVGFCSSAAVVRSSC